MLGFVNQVTVAPQFCADAGAALADGVEVAAVLADTAGLEDWGQAEAGTFI